MIYMIDMIINLHSQSRLSVGGTAEPGLSLFSPSTRALGSFVD